ncbi:BgTH12-05179 [Blumeria graminis f. sp. triticale]|uniref:BgtE-20039 n=3 Tax=Blumeria graminis TaxID=34373 RepID=A0A381L1D3_BLUGR|nr:BgTH12-05179 [Blumeria graminis f. sp. triticale]VDB88005.1 BgtE-20039 [Blumeria graminis f. sp. tritici]
MRFSSIAIIFQSASIFATVLAGRVTNHILDQWKNFDCEGREFKGTVLDPLRQQAAKRVLDREVPPADESMIMNLKSQVDNLTYVLYVDDYPASYYFQKIEGYSTSLRGGDYFYETDYIYVLDGYGRACAIMMKKSTYHYSATRYEIANAQATYQLCTIST